MVIDLSCCAFSFTSPFKHNFQDHTFFQLVNFLVDEETLLKISENEIASQIMFSYVMECLFCCDNSDVSGL